MSRPDAADRPATGGITIVRRDRPALCGACPRMLFSIWTDHQSFIEKLRESRKELPRRSSQGDLIRELKTALLKSKADLERETDRQICEFGRRPTASGDVDFAPGCCGKKPGRDL